MTFDAQFMALITPVSILTAIGSGIAMGMVINHLRPKSDRNITAYLCIVLAALWYLPQALQLLLTTGGGAGTLGRMTLFLLGFVLPMWATMRYKKK